MNLLITDHNERDIIHALDSALTQTRLKQYFDNSSIALDNKLEANPSLLLAWETVPLDLYGVRLPDEIKSSWVFILKAGVATLPERHPNSHQRMAVYRGAGDFQVWGDGEWRSNILVDDPSADVERRWVTIPPNVWHRSMKPSENLVVVSFHTATENDLIEENGDPLTLSATHQRKYSEA